MFNQGDLRLIVLRLISESPRHGYEIIKAIESESMGAYRPSAGAIYPILGHLEELDYIAVSSSSNGKKVHEITTAGTAFLSENEDAIRSMDNRLGRMRKFSDNEQSQQIRRAMDNLKMGLRMRLTREPLGENEIHRIVDAIDAAAVAVERA